MIPGLKCPVLLAVLWPLMRVNSNFSLFQTYPLYSYFLKREREKGKGAEKEGERILSSLHAQHGAQHAA